MEKLRRVLLVIKDKNLSEILYNYLSNHFKVTSISHIPKLFSLLENQFFNIIIIDTNNNSGNVLELCLMIKKESSSKVIFLSGSNDMALKEKCFECGCNDFILKPFVPKELLLRINSQLGIYESRHNSIIEHRGLQLNSVNQSIKMRNCLVNLSNTEYMIMEYLVKNGGFQNSKAIITYLSTIKEKPLTNSALTVNVKRIRAKLEKETGMSLIKNRYGKGYYLGI